MYCENLFCLFNQNCRCLNTDVSIDSFGHCDSCILVELNTQSLVNVKNAQLQAVKDALSQIAKKSEE